MTHEYRTAMARIISDMIKADNIHMTPYQCHICE